MSKKKVTSVTNLVILVLTPVLSVATLFVGIWQFQKEQREANIREIRLKLYEKRMEAYVEIAEVTASIVAVSRHSIPAESTIADFYQTYYGKLVSVEDESVIEALMRFKADLEDYLVNNDRQQAMASSQVDLTSRMNLSLRKLNDLIIEE